MKLLRELLHIFTALEHKPLPTFGNLRVWLERRRKS